MASFATELWPGGPPPPPPLLYVPLGIGLVVFCYLVCFSESSQADRKPLLPSHKADSATAPPPAAAPPLSTPTAPRTGRSPPVRGAWAPPPPSPGIRMAPTCTKPSEPLAARPTRVSRERSYGASINDASAPRRSPDFQAEAANARRPRWPGDGSGSGSDGGGSGGGSGGSGSPLAGRGRVRFSRAGLPLSGCAAATPRKPARRAHPKDEPSKAESLRLRAADGPSLRSSDGPRACRSSAARAARNSC